MAFITYTAGLFTVTDRQNWPSLLVLVHLCRGGGKEWKSGTWIQRSAWIDRHCVVPFKTKAARSRWKPSADGKQRAWREMWVPLERIQLHLRQTCQKKQLNPSAGQGRHSSSAGALGVRMGARLSESLTGTVKGQPVPGRWRQLLGLVTWEGRKYKGTTWACQALALNEKQAEGERGAEAVIHVISQLKKNPYLKRVSYTLLCVSGAL